MKRFAVLGGLGLAILQSASAQEIANCRNPQGPSYFHFSGMTAKADSGWSTDKISGGRISLIRAGEQVDVFFTDVRGKPFSSIADGGKVVLLRSGAESATVLVAYPKSTEIYTFFREKDGGGKFTMFQTKTSDTTPVGKSALLLGDCDAFNFDALK